MNCPNSFNQEVIFLMQRLNQAKKKAFGFRFGLWKEGNIILET
jgi:hypothetical protein